MNTSELLVIRSDAGWPVCCNAGCVGGCRKGCTKGCRAGCIAPAPSYRVAECSGGFPVLGDSTAHEYDGGKPSLGYLTFCNIPHGICPLCGSYCCSVVSLCSFTCSLASRIVELAPDPLRVCDNSFWCVWSKICRGMVDSLSLTSPRSIYAFHEAAAGPFWSSIFGTTWLFTRKGSTSSQISPVITSVVEVLDVPGGGAYFSRAHPVGLLELRIGCCAVFALFPLLFVCPVTLFLTDLYCQCSVLYMTEVLSDFYLVLRSLWCRVGILRGFPLHRSVIDWAKGFFPSCLLD